MRQGSCCIRKIETVVEDAVIRLAAEAGSGDDAGWESIKLDLGASAQQAELFILVEDRPARLAELVPVARALSQRITEGALRQAELGGARVPCTKGCSACCYYLVSLSVPEVFCLWEETLAMPARQRLGIEQASLAAARRVLSDRPPEGFAECRCQGTTECPAELLDAASQWYREFELPCPFLAEGICTIYEQRPISCREYHVTSDAGSCGGGEAEPERLLPAVRMSEVLGRLAAEVEGTGVEALMLPLALIWAGDNQQRGRRTWPAPLLAERFAQIVAEQMQRSSVGLETPRAERPYCLELSD